MPTFFRKTPNPCLSLKWKEMGKRESLKSKSGLRLPSICLSMYTYPCIYLYVLDLEVLLYRILMCLFLFYLKPWQRIRFKSQIHYRDSHGRVDIYMMVDLSEKIRRQRERERQGKADFGILYSFILDFLNPYYSPSFKKQCMYMYMHRPPYLYNACTKTIYVFPTQQSKNVLYGFSLPLSLRGLLSFKLEQLLWEKNDGWRRKNTSTVEPILFVSSNYFTI